MAVYSQGCSVSFTGFGFSEVVSVSLNLGGSIPIGRDDSLYAQDAGTVTVEAFGGSFYHGSYGWLTITGAGLDLTVRAVCTEVSASVQTNDVARYTVTFTLIQ